MFNENFWILTTFILLILWVYKPIKNFIIDLLDQRRRTVIHELEEADKIKESALQMLKNIEQEYANIKQNADDILHQAQLEAQAILEEAKEQSAKINKKRTELFMQRLMQQEQQLFNEVKQEAIELALATVQMKFLEEMDENSKLSLIDDSLCSLNKLIH